MAVYSFLSISCLFVGPGIASNLAAGAAIAEEGITLEAAEDKNKMDIGADGVGQHTLIASDAATLTIRTLKTSPANAALQIAYDTQSLTPSLWGLNQVSITDSNRGDVSVLVSVAFKKKATITYAKEAGMMEWTFDVINANSILGGGL